MPVQPKKPPQRLLPLRAPADTEDTGAGARQNADAGASKYKSSTRSYRFQRAKPAGLIEVLNENSYVMAEYSERTGVVRWRRVVLASERLQIENRLKDHYPPRAGKPD